MQNDTEIPPNEVHLWVAFTEEIHEPDLIEAYMGLLTAEEASRRQRFHFPRHRHRYLVTRALLRTTLSRYADIDPEEWRFSKNAYGRPEIQGPGELSRLRFNLSHTDGVVVCGIARDHDIGVDIEYINKNTGTVDIANRYFAPMEADDLKSLPVEKQKKRFFQYWTLKESYIKARGMGLSLPLEKFGFRMHPHDKLDICFSENFDDAPERWQFWLIELMPPYPLAVSLRRGDARDYHLVFKRVIPLRSEYDISPPILRCSEKSKLK